MAFSAWTNNTAFSVGDVRRATTVQSSGLVFRCTTAGTSGATEPSPWPIERGATVEDGTAKWLAVSSVAEELNKLAPSAVIELFELDGTSSKVGIPSVYRFHAGTNQDIDGNIVWGGVSYSRYPVQARGFQYEGQGSLPRPTLTISNALSLVTSLMLDHGDLVGAKVTRIRTLKKYLDAANFTGDSNATADPYAEFPRQIFTVDRKTLENRDVVSFELAANFDVAGVRLPRRQIVQNVCTWTYKGEGCGYSGQGSYDIFGNPVPASQDVCAHTVEACKLRFGTNAELPYGGFPSVGLIG